MRKLIIALAALMAGISTAYAVSAGLTAGWEDKFSVNCGTKYTGTPSVWVDIGPCEPHYWISHIDDTEVIPFADQNVESITITLQIANAANLKSVQDGGTNVYVTPFLWRKDDTLTGQGQYEFYRLWAPGQRIKIVNGTFTVTIPMDRLKWTGVFGRNPSDSQWDDTLNKLKWVGITFGGQSDFGHGVKGEADVYITKYEWTLKGSTPPPPPPSCTCTPQPCTCTCP